MALAFCFSAPSMAAEKPCLLKKIPGKPLFIAHAGGGVNGMILTNSLEALQSNKKVGHTHFEMDFNWTADGKLALIHDWGPTLNELHLAGDGLYDRFVNWLIKYNYKHIKGYPSPDLPSFLALRRKGGLTSLSLPGLAKWLAANPQAYIVTDVKQHNLAALKLISEKMNNQIDRIIPQIYQFEEYLDVQQMGYANVILTIYRMNRSEDEIVDFCQRHSPWALTIPLQKALETSIPQRLGKIGQTVYVHTINQPKQLEELCRRGIYGVYTDVLVLR